MYRAGKRTSLRKNGVNASKQRKKDNHNGIKPILNDTNITISIANKFAMS